VFENTSWNDHASLFCYSHSWCHFVWKNDSQLNRLICLLLWYYGLYIKVPSVNLQCVIIKRVIRIGVILLTVIHLSIILPVLNAILQHVILHFQHILWTPPRTKGFITIELRQFRGHITFTSTATYILIKAITLTTVF